MQAKEIILILAGLASTSALAQTRIEGAPSPADRTTTVTLIQAQTENGITYLCGGVGQTEAEAMKQAASEFDLMMTFAASNGAYLADVNVDLADARGQSILSTTCGGPIMLVDFPKGGKYRIRAEAGGQTLTRTAQVGGKVKTLAMSWPVKTVDMGLSPTLRAGQSSGSSAGAGSAGAGSSAGSGNSAGSDARQPGAR